MVASLGLPTISMGDAAVLAHCPEEILGAAAEPLAKGEVRAIVIGTKVCSDQDTLKTEKEKAIIRLELVYSFSNHSYRLLVLRFTSTRPGRWELSVTLKLKPKVEDLHQT